MDNSKEFEVSFSSKMPFGKYKGKTFKELAKKDPFYIHWLYYQQTIFTFNFSIEFQNYIENTQFLLSGSFKFPMGEKFKDRTLSSILESDPSFIFWIKSICEDTYENKISLEPRFEALVDLKIEEYRNSVLNDSIDENEFNSEIQISSNFF